MADVTVQRRIYSKVPGQVGSWVIQKVMVLDRVPVAGDSIVLAEGWASSVVKHVTLQHGGGSIADLVPCATDSPYTLGECSELISKHGWEQTGGPWKGQ